MSKNIRITEKQLRSIINNVIKENKDQLSEIFDMEDDKIQTYGNNSTEEKCELCGDSVSKEEISYNKGICSYCSRTPQPGSENRIPGLNWSANESRKRKR